ncbi:UNKNOWN [Stylonychia lemnae]|uniref:Uncharacterized protein n=1 Tax=Stylonychia lemnae TaxID=5949 RepID=A0A078A756_STYLE|nr:UNKNOWN [Stylonychia lemnae]|eukprot:CDW78079.1 UNKNOWN [Stylonychia lemnae]
MLDAFFLNTEDLSFYHCNQQGQGAGDLSQDDTAQQIIQQRLVQRYMRQTMAQQVQKAQSLTSSNEFQQSLLAVSRPYTVEEGGKLRNRSQEQQILNQHRLQNDNYKSVSQMNNQYLAYQDKAMMRSTSTQGQQYIQQVTPGVVPAGNLQRVSDIESEIQKIYSQRQYTEIAMSILTSLKNPNSKKQRIKGLQVGGPFNAKNAALYIKEGSLSSRYEGNSSFFNNFGNAYKANLPQRQQIKSLRERFMNVVSEYDSNSTNINKSSPSKKISTENLTSKSSYNNFPDFSRSVYSPNKKDRKKQEKTFNQEIQQKYQQIKKETKQQWDQVIHQNAKQVSTNKLLQNYQKQKNKNLFINDQNKDSTDQYQDNRESSLGKSYFGRRLQTDHQNSFNNSKRQTQSRNDAQQVSSYSSFGVLNHEKLQQSTSGFHTGQFTNRNFPEAQQILYMSPLQSNQAQAYQGVQMPQIKQSGIDRATSSSNGPKSIRSQSRKNNSRKLKSLFQQQQQ